MRAHGMPPRCKSETRRCRRSWGENVGIAAAVHARVSAIPTPSERLANPDALLSRGDLAELGLGRRQVDAVFRALPVVVFPETRRPLVRVCDYLELVERSTYRGDRVR
jgi:hypothetical protein